MFNRFLVGVFLAFSLFLAQILIMAPSVWARIGVGVGTGKIEVQEQLKPGAIYQLPTLNVVNTGDETSEYSVGISYHEKQPELKPAEGWFIFSPQTFKLEPNEVKTVDVKLNLSITTPPGKYFAYLEAQPANKVQNGQTSIGVAAATKLYFNVESANWLFGVYYKLSSFWQVYAPWPQRFLTALLGVGVIIMARKFLNIEINLKSIKKTPPHQHTDHNP